tara:strand:+ start:260 stop:631 length:372 start_codon:yes stop_codon:yes gene_type:complete
MSCHKDHKEDPKKKGPFDKLKESIDDKEDQIAIVSNFVRLGVLIWSGFILTLNYITIPGWQQSKIDPTFIASVFTGTLSTYGVEAAKKRDKSVKEGEKSSSIPTQIIRVEQAPIKIVTDSKSQ